MALSWHGPSIACHQGYFQLSFRHMSHDTVPAAAPAVDAIECAIRIPPEMLGHMQDWPLVLTKILDYAAKSHGEQEVITCTAEGPVHRYTYADMHIRSQSCALALQQLGVRYARSSSLLAALQKQALYKHRTSQRRSYSGNASIQHISSHGELVSVFIQCSLY